MIKRFLPLLIFVLLAALLAMPLLQGKNTTEVPSVLIGKAAPDMPAVPKGKPALVNFFASWCLPCVEEQPLLVSMKDRIDIYGVAYKDKPSATKGFLKKLGNPYKAYITDADGRLGITWGISGVPETFALDKDGIVRARHVGPLTARDVEKLLEALQ